VLTAAAVAALVATGGFDTHDDQLADQPGLLGNVSASLEAFYKATVGLGAAKGQLPTVAPSIGNFAEKNPGFLI
jgi:uncharacterized protein (DUF1501 family)